MDNYKSLSELTEAAIQKEQQSAVFSGPALSLAEAIRQNLESWEVHLFPLLKAQKKPIYEFLVEMLKEAGYENVSVSALSTYICRARRDRKNGSK